MTKTTLELTRGEALEILTDAGSHSFLVPEAGQAIAKAFGLDMAPQKVTTGGFKGLSVPGVPVGEKVEGYAGWVLAEKIARHLKPDWGCHAEGRGTRFHHAVLEIQKHLA